MSTSHCLPCFHLVQATRIILIVSWLASQLLPLPLEVHSPHNSQCRLLSCVWLFVTPWTGACQAPLSMEFSRQEYWSGFPLPPPGDLPDPGIESVSPALEGGFFTAKPPGKLLCLVLTDKTCLLSIRRVRTPEHEASVHPEACIPSDTFFLSVDRKGQVLASWLQEPQTESWQLHSHAVFHDFKIF